MNFIYSILKYVQGIFLFHPKPREKVMLFPLTLVTFGSNCYCCFYDSFGNKFKDTADKTKFS